MSIKSKHIYGALTAGAVVAGLGVYFNTEKNEPWTDSITPVTPISVSAGSQPRAGEEQIAAIKTFFEEMRADMIAKAPVILAEKKAASPDGEGRIIVYDDTVEIFDKPLTVTTYNDDIEKTVTPAADMVFRKDPTIFSLTEDQFQQSVITALSDDNFPGASYVPFAEIYHVEQPAATYDVDSDRICQPMADAWKDATMNTVDCFPAASLASDAPLARDVATIKRHLAAAAPAPAQQ